MATEIWVALLGLLGMLMSGGAAIIVGYFQHRKSTALMEYKLDEVIKKQDKHNKLIERTYELEKNVEVLKTDIQNAKDRIEDLEDK